MTKNETGLISDIKKYVRLNNGYIFKVHGDAYVEVGTPDLFICLLGQFVAIEAKKPGSGNEPTEIQLRRLREIKAAGGIAFWANSMNKVVEVLTGYGLVDEIT